MNTSLMFSKWGRKLGKELMKGKMKQVKEKKQVATNRWNIVRGDIVHVIEGPQTGQQGKVLQVLRKANRIIVEGVNMRNRNVKPKLDGTPGKRVVIPCTIHYSNVMLVDPSTNEPTKVFRRYLEDGTKVRVSKKTGTIIAKPDPLGDRRLRSSVVGPKDTEPADVFAVTFEDYEKHLPFVYASERSKGSNND